MMANNMSINPTQMAQFQAMQQRQMAARQQQAPNQQQQQASSPPHPPGLDCHFLYAQLI